MKTVATGTIDGGVANASRCQTPSRSCDGDGEMTCKLALKNGVGHRRGNGAEGSP